jgi:D-alanyl-D-alanine carboxypeptidase (penicillin-binding protein 5/6)
MLTLALSAPCFAQAPADQQAAPPATLQIAAPPLPQRGKPTTPEVHSRYCVLMDVDSGQILWARNPDAHRAIASTTKILTAILLLERGHPYDIVTAPAGVEQIPESSLHLTAGETIPLHDLMYALLLRSANDTAVAGADYLAGSIPAFAQMMNEKAAEIGARNSHFVTPNGLYDPNHYSTAADMALIARYAVTHLPEFNEIVATKRYRVSRSIHKDDSVVINTASTFLKTFPGADGIKTGYIRQAGHCFVSSATRNGWRLIAVSLDSNRCREDDESLLNYGFANFVPVPATRKGDVVGQVSLPNGDAPVNAVLAQDAQVVVSRWRAMPAVQTQFAPSNPLPPAPVAAGTKLGVLRIMLNGKTVSAMDAVAASQVAQRPSAVWMRKGRQAGAAATRWAGIACGAIVLLGFAKGIYARTASKSNGVRRDRLKAEVRGADLE